ncbi:MAG TPA: sugar transferase [Candidatus Limnocylindria bacterium]|nr:sugar transferase [Candidatus Limnocylindria bacterium]
MGRTSRNSKNQVIGILTESSASAHLGADDETVHGAYWFDLRARRPIAARVKRAIDVAASLALIVVFAPLILALIVLIKLTSPGPAIFVQRRIGFRCNEFGMYKFRTMIADAERLQKELAAGTPSEFFKLQSDPRVTPLGRFLRRFSLDELPQLFNVLEGSMSLVGPRPLLLSDLGKFPLRGQMRRFSVRPGITGLWQVSGRSALSDKERMRLDREYVSHWSLWLDLRILARTVAAVFSGRGAT